MHFFSNLTQRLPSGVADKLEPVGVKLDLAFSDQGPRSVAARAALLTFCVRVFNAALAYASQIILARMMGQYEYGVFAILWVWVMVLATFCALGWPSGILRFVPELYKKGRYDELRMVLRRGGLVNVGFATLLGAAGIMIVVLMPDLVQQPFAIPLILAAICLPLMTVLDNQDAVAQSFDWPDLVNIPSFVARPFLMLGLFVMFAGVGVGMGFEVDAAMAMMATLVSVWMVITGQYLVLRRRLNKKLAQLETTPQDSARDSDDDRAGTHGSIRPYIKAALPMLAVEGFFFLIINTDIMVAGLFVEPDQVGIYYAAAKTLALVHFVYFAIRIATAHKISEYFALGNETALRATLRDAIHWTFWPSLAIAISLAFSADLILGLFGEGFEQGSVFLYVLLIGVVIRASIGPAEAMLTMANAQSTAAWLYGAVFVVNIALNFALIPVMGLMGAALATALSMCAETILLAIAVRKKLGILSFIGFVGRLKADQPSLNVQAEPAE